MKIDMYHPLRSHVRVHLDDKLLDRCIEADDELGYAVVVLRGTVRFEELPGHEDKLDWFRIGYAMGSKVEPR